MKYQCTLYAVNKKQFLFDFKELRHKTNNVVQKACLFAFMKLDTYKKGHSVQCCEKQEKSP